MDFNIFKKYFFLNLKDYPNIGVDIYINQVILIFTVGIIIASFLINYNRTGINLIVKRMLRKKALTSDSALTLDELGVNSFRTRSLLLGSGQLKKLVGRVGEETLSYEEYIKLTRNKKYKEERLDFTSARFYLREEMIGRSRHIVEVGTTSMLNAVLFAILLISVYICLSLLMPDILNFINNMLGN